MKPINNTPRIIDPVHRKLPIMYSIQDAAKLNLQERTTFYVSAFLSQVWICELTLANSAKLAEQPDPTKRSFQSGEAWRGFQKYFGNAKDAELPGIFRDLMQFGDCDDPLAFHVLHSAFPLSVEHEFTGDFVGSRTSRQLLNAPKRFIALIRSTITRLCDWLDSELHLRLLEEWHVMPDCFDPDPKKRELALLGIQQRHFDQLNEQSKLRFLNSLADSAVEQKKSPNWAAFRQTGDNPPPPHRPWPTEELDSVIIKLWPLVKRYGWTAAHLLDVLRQALEPAGLAPCPDTAALVAYCNNTLGLRWSANRAQPSTLNSQRSVSIALRLLHVTDDSSQQTKTE